LPKNACRGWTNSPIFFLEGASDLAVEILFPSNTVEEIHDKLVEYFENGAHLVGVIHPKEHYVLVYRSSQPSHLLKSTDSLDGDEVIPGFTFQVADLFQTLTF
jgi:Uma2 family endonuclease